MRRQFRQTLCKQLMLLHSYEVNPRVWVGTGLLMIIDQAVQVELVRFHEDSTAFDLFWFVDDVVLFRVCASSYQPELWTCNA